MSVPSYFSAKLRGVCAGWGCCLDVRRTERREAHPRQEHAAKTSQKSEISGENARKYVLCRAFPVNAHLSVDIRVLEIGISVPLPSDMTLTLGLTLCYGDFSKI